MRLFGRWMSVAALGALSLVLGSCEPAGPQPAGAEAAAVDTAAIVASVDEIRVGLEQAFAARDVDAMASLYARDAIFSPRDGPQVHGRDSIRAYFDRHVPPGVNADIEVTDLRVLSPEWAYAYGTISLAFTPEGMSAPVELPATFLVMLRNTSEEGWKIYRESLSADAPLLPPNPS